MKPASLTIRLDRNLARQLTQVTRASGKTRSEVAREALRRQLRIARFEHMRTRIMPYAEARGYVTDEDVFKDVS